MQKNRPKDEKYLWTFVDENDMVFWSHDSQSVYMAGPAEFMPRGFIDKQNNILKSPCAFNPFKKSDIVAGGISTKGKNYYQSIGRHDYFSLIIVANGRIALSCEGAKQILNKGAFILVPPSAACSFYVKSAPAPILWFNLGLKWGKLIGNCENIYISECAHLDFLVSISEAYISELFSEVPDMQILSECSDLIMRALRRELPQRRSALKGFERAEACISRIERGSVGKFRAADFARKLGVSLYKLNEYALRTRNMTISKIVHKKRMELAQQMLSGGNATCAEISKKLGFSNQFAFSKSYKVYYGTSPSLHSARAIKGNI